MIDKQALAQQLTTPEFYKKAYPGLFGGSNRKFALKTWESAVRKGIADAVLLRETVYESFTYRVFAFSTEGSIPEEQCAQLKTAADQFEVNQIRYEAVGVPGFFAVYNKDGNFIQNGYEIMPMCRQLNNTYLVVVSDTKPEELDCPCVAYTFNPDNSLYFWCIARKYL